MKISDTISVNPGKTAMGHVENPSSTLFRSHILGNESQTIDMVKVAMPSAKAGLSDFRRFDMPLRTLFATILIVCGISLLTFSGALHGVGFAVTTLCFGVFLALGLFTRPVMLGAAVYYCIVGALGLRGGVADFTVFSLMFGCLIFAVTGAGRYSCDSLLRHSVMSHRKNLVKRRRENLMSYKAFHSVKF